MFPTNAGRVTRNTAPQVNRQIRRRTERNIARASAAGRGAAMRRLAELDREWDIERTLQANAATLVVLGTALGALKDRRFHLVPAVVGGFLLQHALQGWCPPLNVFRRLGVRTEAEIDYEREKLKAYLEGAE
jgi:hypothetical protein